MKVAWQAFAGSYSIERVARAVLRSDAGATCSLPRRGTVISHARGADLLAHRASAISVRQDPRFGREQ